MRAISKLKRNARHREAVGLIASLLFLCLGLAACTSSQQGVIPASSTSLFTQVPTTSATLTGPQLDATKYAEDARVQQTMVAAMTAYAIATPVPPTFEPTVTVGPMPSPELGLHSCGDGSRYLDVGSCWTGQTNDAYISVVSGAPKSDPSQSVMHVITTTSDQRSNGQVITYTAPSQVGVIHIAYVDWPHMTLISNREVPTTTTFVFNLLTRTWEQPGQCQLYPIAVNAAALSGGGNDARYIVRETAYGTNSGNFGWLSWNGDMLPDTLAQSLTLPGNSNTYNNPDNPSDHVVSVGDWVLGRPEVNNNQAVDVALRDLMAGHYAVTVPVWDQVTGQGNNPRYHVSGFAWMYGIEQYSLQQPNSISLRYWGPAGCPDGP